MGVLATAFARAFLGPSGNGSNADGSPYAPVPSDAAALGQAADNAIPNAQDLSAEATARITSDQSLQEQISGEVTARTNSDESFQAQISAEITAREQGDESLQAQISAAGATVGQHTTQISDLNSGLTGLQGEITSVNTTASDAASGVAGLRPQIEALQGAVATANSAAAAADSASSALDGLTADLVDLQVTAMLGARPGDSPALFTTDLYAGISGVPANGSAVTNADGRAMRIVGRLPFYGPTGLRAIEPAHVYKVRAAHRRIVDTTDTSGDAVHVAVAWYGVDRNLLGLAPLLIADDTLTVADGRVERSALISTAPSDASVLPIPAGAAYFRPFVSIFGDVPTTDVEVIESADVSDAGLIMPDLDAANAAIAALQAQVRLLAAAASITLS